MTSRSWARWSEITAQVWQAHRSRPKTPLSKLDRLIYWKQRGEIIQNPQKIIEHKKFVMESFSRLNFFGWVGVGCFLFVLHIFFVNIYWGKKLFSFYILPTIFPYPPPKGGKPASPSLALGCSLFLWVWYKRTWSGMNKWWPSNVPKLYCFTQQE